jgi:formate hydrogenlyase subunit 3/multisubunit Na+/H+ antiporter MnhD subunit
MNGIISIITLPLLAGLLLFLVPTKLRVFRGIIALIVCIIVVFLSVSVFTTDNQSFVLNKLSSTSGMFIRGMDIIRDAEGCLALNLDNLSKLIMVFISVVSLLICIYSLAYDKTGNPRSFYPYFLITLGCSYGALFSDNLLLFLFFWGILGISLYKLISANGEEGSAAAKKTLILIGASDSIMIIGIAILWKITGSLNMSSISVHTSGLLAATAFLSLLAGSFTKAGAFPFHTWVPDYAENAGAASSAYLPASLDKLLGIYFLARITNKLFIMGEGMQFLLLSLGVISIISAVMMALIQHNMRRLLGYHAVSQVGYMILGFGLGSTVGVAAGLFHMFNNVIYKSGLFLSTGSIEQRTGKTEIDELGGLSASMPLTCFATIIFSMSISGIPPFNGFASKWMIYQGIIDFGTGNGIAHKLWILWLGLAVLGSALTLASFIKLAGGVFLGRRRPEFESVRETSVLMWLPITVLALTCIFAGIFATNLIVPKVIMPVTGVFMLKGFWDSSFVSLLVLISFILGAMVYMGLNSRKFRTEDSFIGGESIQEETKYPSTEFYKTLLEFKPLSTVYRKAAGKLFDLYDLSKSFVLWISHQFSEAHSGVLPEYVIWIFAGLIIMFLIML